MERRADEQSEDRQSDCEPPDTGYPAVEGFVFHPESYRGCAPFRIRAVSREFRTSVGPGPIACYRVRRAYLAYGISYENVELGPGEGADGGARGVEAGLSTFLAVRLPEREDPPLPHVYFQPDQRYQFVSAGDEVVFHTRCSEPTTPMQEATFATVE